MVSNFFKKHRSQITEYLFLILILVIGFILRSYQIGNLNSFFHDQGRDALIIKRIIVDHKFTLLGPQTTAPGVYLGPFYYYLMILPLWIANLNPASIDFMVAITGIFSILVLYLLIKEFYGKLAGILTAALYATNPTIVSFSNHAWNPNPLPLFMLLSFYSLFKAIKTKKILFWILSGFSLGLAIQLHLFALVLVPLILIMQLVNLKKQKLNNLISCWFSFLLAISPWILFELRHNFINTKNLIFFFLSPKIGLNIGNSFQRIEDVILWFGTILNINLIIYLISFASFFIVTFFIKKLRFSNILVFLWLTIGLILLGVYRGIFQLYHALFLTPIPFIIYGFFISLTKSNRILKITVIIITTFLIFQNLRSFSSKRDESRVTSLKKVAEIITKDSGDKSINLAGITWRFDHNAMDYRYFTELAGKKALDLENYQDTELLYVIDENQNTNLLKTKIMEISEFKPKKITNKWQINNSINLYRLEK